MTKNVALVNPSTGLINNIIIANPNIDSSPIEGDIMVDVDGLGYVIGGTILNGVYTPPDGEIYSTPTPSAQQLAASAMAAGLVIASTGTPELNGTYGLDANSQNNVSATVMYILLNGNFPGNSATMPWVDATGAPHVWPSTTEFKAFATAFANFVSAVALYAASNGASGSIPSNEVTIP